MERHHERGSCFQKPNVRRVAVAEVLFCRTRLGKYVEHSGSVSLSHSRLNLIKPAVACVMASSHPDPVLFGMTGGSLCRRSPVA